MCLLLLDRQLMSLRVNKDIWFIIIVRIAYCWIVPKLSKTEKNSVNWKKITVLYFDNKGTRTVVWKKGDEESSWLLKGHLFENCYLLTSEKINSKKLKFKYWNKIKTHQVSDIHKIVFITPWRSIFRLIIKVFTYTLYLSGWYLRASFR